MAEVTLIPSPVKCARSLSTARLTRFYAASSDMSSAAPTSRRLRFSKKCSTTASWSLLPRQFIASSSSGATRSGWWFAYTMAPATESTPPYPVNPSALACSANSTSEARGCVKCHLWWCFSPEQAEIYFRNPLQCTDMGAYSVCLTADL